MISLNDTMRKIQTGSFLVNNWGKTWESTSITELSIPSSGTSSLSTTVVCKVSPKFRRYPEKLSMSIQRIWGIWLRSIGDKEWFLLPLKWRHCKRLAKNWLTEWCTRSLVQGRRKARMEVVLRNEEIKRLISSNPRVLCLMSVSAWTTLAV